MLYVAARSPLLQRYVVEATEEASSQLPGYVPPQRVAAPKVRAGGGRAWRAGCCTVVQAGRAAPAAPQLQAYMRGCTRFKTQPPAYAAAPAG